MIRMRPLEVDASELVAPRVARLPALGRLSAPTHSGAFWRALWTVAATASFVALIPARFRRAAPPRGFEVIHTLSGVSFAACGLITWRRRPDSAIGALLT